MTSEETVWITRLAISAMALPLFSFLLALLIRPRFEWIVPILSSFILLLNVIISIIIFTSVWNSEPLRITWHWFVINGSNASAQWALTNLSVLMLIVVNLISFFVHIYSIGYMAGDQGVRRYFGTLGLFTFSMIGILLSDHFLLTFFFWELVGFSSYLLIGHWREKPEAGAAATKAFIFNRIGDAGFLIGIGILWAHSDTLNFTTLSQTLSNESWLTWASLFIFCGVIGKSAQFPLLTWLPDAMEGPTPVSALIHAATMVAAGVFLLARVYFLFTPHALIVVSIIGAITSLWGAWGALREFDIKKILAYSTVSQLGFMIMGMGSGSFSGSIMHLFTHAFFKACLFLGAGAIIHYLHRVQHHSHQHFDVQDIRNMGGLRKHLPYTFIAFAIAGASLAGAPLFSGFVSKDAIITQWYDVAQSGAVVGWIFLSACFIISFLTVYYTFRLIWFIFFGECSIADQIAMAKEERVPSIMMLPIVVLAICSFWIVVSLNPFATSGWLSNGLNNAPSHNYTITIISTVWILLAVSIAYFNLRNKKSWTPVKFFLNLDKLFAPLFINPALKLSGLTLAFDKRWIDRGIHLAAYVQVSIAFFTGWCDRILVDGSVNGIARLAGGIGSFTRSFAGGKIQSYILWAMAALIIFILWILLF